MNFRFPVEMDQISLMLEGSGFFGDSVGVALCDDETVLAKILICLTLVGSVERGVELSCGGGGVWLRDEELGMEGYWGNFVDGSPFFCVAAFVPEFGMQWLCLVDVVGVTRVV